MKNLHVLFNECVEELKRINMDISNNIVEVKVNGRLSRSLGRCVYNRRYGSYTIEINPCMLGDSVEINATKNTIIHELIHTCPGCMNHGYQWKRRGDRVNRMLGYNISRCASSNELEADGVEIKLREYKYALECPTCGNQWKYRRWCESLENPSRYQCSKCKSKLHTIGLNGNDIWSAAHKVRVKEVKIRK